jgi:hypothetical protein
MRAILIDSEKRTITEIEFEGDYRTIQAILNCHSFTSGSRPLNGSLEEGFDALYVSDDALDERDDPRFWFQVDADHNPPSSYPLAGLGLVLGVDEQGKGRAARISVEELTRRIAFTQRKFRGFETFTGAAAHARGAHFVIEAKTPIIDGADERDRDDPEAR